MTDNEVIVDTGTDAASLAWTPIRHRWLTTLDQHPGTRRQKGTTGFFVHRAGLAKWIDSDIRQGEELTDAGRELLARWDTEHGNAKVIKP